MDPTTMPAIAPPLRPCRPLLLLVGEDEPDPAPALLVDDGAPLLVVDRRLGIVENTGSVTP